MGISVFKHSRRSARRYRIKHNEPKAIRFASSKNRRISTTHIFDISETGVAFTTAERTAPHIGEIIKMDFSPMAGLQIACTGRVVRIEEPTKNSTWAKFPDTVKVGVVFHQMPRLYRRALAESLLTALEYTESTSYSPTSVSKSFDYNLNFKNTWLYENHRSVLTTIAIVGILLLGTYFLLISIKTEQPKTNAPWAEGFFNKVIDRPKR